MILEVEVCVIVLRLVIEDNLGISIDFVDF